MVSGMPRTPPTPPRVVAVVAHKGGVGGTSLVSHTTPPLVELIRARRGADARLLVLDASSLGGATYALTGMAPGGFATTITEVLTGQASLAEAVVALDASGAAADGPVPGVVLPAALAAARSGVDLIPANKRAADLMVTRSSEVAALRSLLHRPHALPGYPVVVIDCGHGTTALSKIAMVAADELVAVMQPQAWDAHGLSSLIQEINELAKTFSHLKLAGVVASMVGDGVADRGALNDLEDQLGPLLWGPRIPYSGVIRRANNDHLPIAVHRPHRPELAALFASLAELIYPQPARSGPHRRRP